MIAGSAGSMAALPTTSPIACSQAMRSAVARAQQFARTTLPVLLVGPTGSGKEVLARYLHACSARAGELVDVNCAALPRDMVESLLFGHRRGAFTGAMEDTLGLVTKAAGGTLFLDELASLPAEGQAKLLRLLDTNEVRRLGETGKRVVDFRLVCAVQEDIGLRVERGEFRKDLYYRVEGIVIHLPGLRDRTEDIVPMARQFAAQSGRTLAEDAADLLERQPWPGNARELRAVVSRASVLSEGAVVCVEAVREALAISSPGHIGAASRPPVNGGGMVAPATSLRDLEQRHIEAVLRECGQSTRAAAAALGLSVGQLYRKYRALGMTPPRLR